MADFAAEPFYDRYWQHRIARGDTDSPKRVKLRHEQAADHLRRVLPAGDGGRGVLDLGCGDGLLGQVLAEDGYRLTGADVSPRVLALAGRWYHGTHRIDLNADDPPPAWRDAFDAVVCLEVLEHLEHPRQTLDLIFACCRPGGAAVFSFPNLFSWKNRLLLLRGRWPETYTTYDPREHLQVLELDRFEAWVRDAGFELTGRAITPDLPRRQPFRRWMFAARGRLATWMPALWAMQVNVFARRPHDAP